MGRGDFSKGKGRSGMPSRFANGPPRAIRSGCPGRKPSGIPAATVCDRGLLILPDGELFEYVCRYCWTQLGKRKVEQERPPLII